MSALCAFPPLIPAGGGVYSAGYMADVNSSNARVGSTVGSFAAAYSSSQQQQQSRNGGSIPAYGSTFAAFHHPSAVAATGNGGKSVIKMTQPESAWSSRSSAMDAPPAAKRRCTDKIRSSAGWTADQQIWPSSAAAIPASVCPSGCTMCHMQQQQQQHHSSQQQQQYTGYTYDGRRPLQEKHQNREDSGSSLKAPKLDVRMPNNNRTLSVDPKKDYSAPLHVDCSVEYDLPRIVRPPPGAQPLLILAPPRPSAVTSLATPTGYHPSTWTSSRPLPPQWNQQQQQTAPPTRIKSDKPSAASVKTHPAAIQQQKLNSTTTTSKSTIYCVALFFKTHPEWADVYQVMLPHGGATCIKGRID